MMANTVHPFYFYESHAQHIKSNQLAPIAPLPIMGGVITSSSSSRALFAAVLKLVFVCSIISQTIERKTVSSTASPLCAANKSLINCQNSRREVHERGSAVDALDINSSQVSTKEAGRNGSSISARILDARTGYTQ